MEAICNGVSSPLRVSRKTLVQCVCAVSLLAWASPFARADSVVSPNDVTKQVTEGMGGTFSWTITNNDKNVAVTLNDDFRTGKPDFFTTGGDTDDDAVRGAIMGCNAGVVLAANGGRCTLTVDFTTPRTMGETEDSERGFWDLLIGAGAGKGTMFDTVDGTAPGMGIIRSGPVRGHLEVDDPGVPPTPEPSSLLLVLTPVLVSGWMLRRRLRSAARVLHSR